MWQGSEELARGHRCGWPQGSHCVWDGTPSLVQSDTVNIHPSRARRRTPRTPHHQVRLHDPGNAMETPADAGVDTAQLTVATELVVSLKKHHTDHRVAGCVCRDCVCVREEKWATVYRVVDETESKIECPIVMYSYSLAIEVCERIFAQRIPSALCAQEIGG